jgi:alpha-L-arabinofuranosidase
MALVEIEIKAIGSSYYAPEATVEPGDTVKIKTNITGQAFDVEVPNKDGFFNTSGTISGSVDNENELPLGDVVSDPKRDTKYYSIDPGIEAPPRIILSRQ